MFHVKHLDESPGITREAVRSALQGAEIPVTLDQAALMAQHANLVLAANARMNLTRIVEPGAVIALHIVDSLAFLPHVDAISGPVVDIGSGAGYPGVPLAAYGYSVTLSESIQKKAAFLRQCVEALGLAVQVVPLRAEEYALQAPEAAALVVARAVSRVSALVELAAPLLVDGGRLIALKGSPTKSELLEGDRAGALCGMSRTACAEYALPTGESRAAIVYERVGRARVSLPRRAGMAQRQPLG